MSRSYPIWNKITACIYKGSKCFGVRNDGLNEILIGTSKSNSHEFVKTRITHKKHDDGTRTYHFYLDDYFQPVSFQYFQRLNQYFQSYYRIMI